MIFAAFGDSEDEDNTDPELGAAAAEDALSHHAPPDAEGLPHHAAPSIAGLDMRKVMHAAGRPDFARVLHDTDVLMEPINSFFASERCGGAARRANLKRKAYDISRSVAETFAYCTLRTVSNEEAAELISIFANVGFCLCCTSEFDICSIVYFHTMNSNAY